MHDLVLNIDNKEILNEILHHSISYLVGTSKPNSSDTKSCHKFGFSDPEEFETAIKFISNLYQQFVLETISEQQLLTHFAHFNQDFQQSVLDVVNTRRFEIQEFLVNEHNSLKNDLMTSFDWDLRWIMGTNSLTTLRTQIATLILNCRSSKSRDLKTIHMELNREMVDKFIHVLEECDKKLSAD